MNIGKTCVAVAALLGGTLAAGAVTLPGDAYEKTAVKLCGTTDLAYCSVSLPSPTSGRSLNVATLACSGKFLASTGIALTAYISDGTTRQNLRLAPQITDPGSAQAYFFLEATGPFTLGVGSNPTVHVLVRSPATTTLNCTMSGTMPAAVP